MSDNEVILGIDTSNYTTSVALVSADGGLIANLKAPLRVKPGERGLRQSDAVFLHVSNFPMLMESVHSYLDGRKLCAVGVSSKPRNQEGSYMPCFLAGVATAEGISATSGLPLYKFSHQCGHIMSALYSSRKNIICGESFGAFHVSGGTTELLKVQMENGGFKAEIVGGTNDLNAGQLIDRLGVYMGLQFPAGPAMEKLADEFSGERTYKRSSSVKGCYFNLSGAENIACRLFDETRDAALVASFVFDYITRSIVKSVTAFIDSYGDMPIIFAGGVMSNSIIKKALQEKFDAYFAEPMLSADNAVGIAELARRKHFGIY